MLELVINPDGYGSRALVPYIVAENIVIEGGSRLISLPMDDDDECALYFDAEEVDELLLGMARSLLHDSIASIMKYRRHARRSAGIPDCIPGILNADWLS